MIAVRAVGAPEDVAGSRISLHCHVEAPDGSSCGDVLDHEIGPLEVPDLRQDWAVGVFFPIAVRWHAANEGTYTLH
ncbi:MAG: hypothetical protein ACRDLV_02370, partial [Solirubrobacteraceae bacterium]